MRSRPSLPLSMSIRILIFPAKGLIDALTQGQLSAYDDEYRLWMSMRTSCGLSSEKKWREVMEMASAVDRNNDDQNMRHIPRRHGYRLIGYLREFLKRGDL